MTSFASKPATTPTPAGTIGGTKVTMTDPQFKQLREVVYKRSGIHFPDNKKYILESRLGHRLAELEMDDFEQYIAFLTMGPYQSDEFQEMFNRITINETSFFRNEPQLAIFEKQILPELLEARKNTRRLRIWSAACSTGEEPFTLAIMVHRTLGIRLPDWRIEILGTDISERALNVANSGKYSNYAMRSTPDLIKNRFFKPDGQNWILDPAVRSMVNFELHNLKDRLAAKRHGTWDVIFCRNVLIYFDDAMKKQVIEMFADQIAPDGTLFIGHSERIRDVTNAFEQMNVPQGFCYRKTLA
jgi:Methylase of chemotaxis methyl-accepting proteins